MGDAELRGLLKHLTSLSHETEWVEFKRNNFDPEEIGEYLSALSNSAALHHQDAGYIVWGVEDVDRMVTGTSFKPRLARVGNEELENWLARLLSPRIDFHLHEFLMDGKPVVIFRVQPATHVPVRFKGTEHIRIGSCKKKLAEHPEKERALWSLFSQIPFEKGSAFPNATAEQVLNLLDYPGLFALMGRDLPENRTAILERLSSEKIIHKKGDHRYDITGLGATLFAKKLSDFESLSRKALRIIIYRGVSRIMTVRERLIDKGYAVGFEDSIRFINDQLPRNEQIGQAFRKDVPMYPEIAIRELVANALIHQDFNLSGTSPLVEIFEDRIEITNPGVPLIEPLRFIDAPPLSRNEKIASLMRRINICEERGSGIDKVVTSIEMFQLPPPDFASTPSHTKATLFVYAKLSDMDRKQKVRACYQHACLCYVSNTKMTNTSLRRRFAIEDHNYSTASRIISDTVDAGLVKSYDSGNTSKRHAKYLPYWA